MTYEQCKLLKDKGYPQKHNKYSKYYLNETQIIDFETAHDVYDNNRKSNDIYEEIDWTKSLTYIPTLEDFLGQDTYESMLNAQVQLWLK